MATSESESDFLFDFTCSLCEVRGEHREAVGFCTDCEDYLCHECFSTHLRPKPSRHHTLLNKADMPKHPSCDLCDDPQAVGYCQDCQDYLCQQCFDTHLRPRPSRNHTLLKQIQMPQHKSSSVHADLGTSSKDAGQARVCDAQTRVPRAPAGRGIRFTRAQHVKNINVKTSDDDKTPWISGCVKLPGAKLVLVDYKNYKVKLVNTTNGALLSQLKLDDEPWGITQTGESQVTVTCPDDKTICFVNVSDTLRLERKVKVKGWCQGIASIKENLVVSFYNSVKVEVLSKTGHVVHTVVTEERGKQLFTYPDYIAVSDDGNTIYVSDCGRNTVTIVDMAGNVKNTYKHGELSVSQGLTVGHADGVIVCGYASGTVHLLTADLTQGHVLLRQSDGVQRPYSVCYSQDTGTLYIGMYNNNVVKVYQLKLY